MKIAIAGYGAEGAASYEYWNTPENQVVIVDEVEPTRPLPVDASVIIGEDAYTRLEGYDMVVRTAGLAPHKITTDGKIWSATNEFFAVCPVPIIGVTGSKGKGTTSSLIASILRASGKRVELLGNIGVPALAALAAAAEADIVVYELSSFQLWDLERGPEVGVVLHIEPDHLDVHADFDEYVWAKANIARTQLTTDRMIYYADNEWSTAIAKQSVGQLLPYPTPRTAHIRGDMFWYGDQELCRIDELQLPGVHNQQNACAAIMAVWPWVRSGSVIAEGLRSFDGLPHRLKFVTEVDGVSYYDDSIATTPGSAIAAIASFTAPKVLIVGGSSKGADFTEFAQAVVAGGVRAVVLIGQEADVIERALRAAAYPQASMRNLGTTDMTTAVAVAQSLAQPGDVVVLSPSCASFGMFRNYVDRGEQFIAAVSQL